LVIPCTVALIAFKGTTTKNYLFQVPTKGKISPFQIYKNGFGAFLSLEKRVHIIYKEIRKTTKTLK